MKILFITVGYLPMPPVSGGAVENLINLFLKFNELYQEHDISVYSCLTKKAKEESNNYKYTVFKYINTKTIKFKLTQLILYVFNFKSKKYIGNAYIKQIASKINSNENNYDVIIVENKPEFIYILKKIIKSKIVLHLHNDYIYKNSKNGKEIIDLYDEVFAVSDYIRDRVRSVNSVRSVHTLFNGIELSKFNKNLFTEEIKEIKTNYGINDDDIIVLYTGRITKAKGVKELIEAFNLMPKEIKCKLVIIGSSIYGKNKKDKYLTELKNLSKNNNEIIFTGYVDYEKMPIYYMLSHIGVVPSLSSEAFPLTVLEHLASSNPVISTMVGGIVDILNEDCSIKVNLDTNTLKESLKDAMIFLCSNEEIRNSMGESAKRTVEHFSNLNFYKNFNKLLIDTTRK